MAYVPLVNLVPQFFDNLGDPLVGGTLSAYVAGTSTPTNMFSDNTGTVAGTSVTLDSRGEPTTIKLIWLDTAVNYKFILKDSNTTTIWTIDNIVPDALVDGSVSTAKLANGAVTTAKLADNAVTTVKITDSNVTTAKIADNAITTVKILDSNVTTAKIADNAITNVKMADNSVNTAEIVDSAITTAKIADANVTPAKLSQTMTRATAVTLTNQTSVDFTGIPSWVRRITVMLDSVSTNGTSALMVQIGDSGGVETTGYISTSGFIQNSATYAGVANYTTGFNISTVSQATHSFSGIMDIVNLTGNVWVVKGITSPQTATQSLFFSAGSKTLSATLDRVRLTTVNGTDQYDAGTVNIIYEG